MRADNSITLNALWSDQESKAALQREAHRCRTVNIPLVLMDYRYSLYIIHGFIAVCLDYHVFHFHTLIQSQTLLGERKWTFYNITQCFINSCMSARRYNKHPELAAVLATTSKNENLPLFTLPNVIQTCVIDFFPGKTK